MLDAYMARIGYAGPRTPTLPVVAELVRRQVEVIPFENFDVLLGHSPRLDADGLVAKLVTARRGGYCYEHASLLAHVLRELGVTVHMHSARVTLVSAREASPRTHMFLTIELGGQTWMLDPGFGGGAPRVPVPMTGAVDDGHGARFELVADGPYTTMRITRGDQVLTAWASTLERDVPVDFAMANHFTATHASSPFTQRIMARAYTADGSEVRLANADVTVTPPGGAPVTRRIARAELRSLVAEHFGFDLPALDTMRVPAMPDWPA